MKPGPDYMAKTSEISVPTLILQGDLDTITPPDQTQAQLDKFDVSLILNFELSHSVLSSSWCAMRYTARFLAIQSLEHEKYDCTFEYLAPR